MSRLLLKFAYQVLIWLVVVSIASAGTIAVPADQPSIQSAIHAAMSGDTVIVSPGTYQENLDFLGKAIAVRSAAGPGATIIDGNQKAPVVSFISGESRSSSLKGFTLRNGLGNITGGGVYILNSSPTVVGNVITANLAGVGGGIGVLGGSPLILNNKVAANIHDPGVSGGWGGGISLEGGSSALVVGNLISNHFWTQGLGGGIAIRMAGSPILRNNIIESNTADQGPGGGVWIIDSSPRFSQNLIVRNTAELGGGIYLDLSSAKFGATFVNDTFADNVGSNGGIIPGDGSAAYLVGFEDRVQFFNEIMASAVGRESLFCATVSGPTLTNNDAFSNTGDGFGGGCSSWEGVSGNISVDPVFIDSMQKNYQLSTGSPVIDLGSKLAPYFPGSDLANAPRRVDGNGDGSVVIDMGAYEFQH